MEIEQGREAHALMGLPDRVGHGRLGAVIRLEGPPPPFADLCAHVRSRLSEAPRFRQRLVAPPVGLRPLQWVDDPDFSLEYHVRHTALPSPGDDGQLEDLAGHIFSQRLDRTKPLWELEVVEGLADGDWALIAKVDRALAGSPDLLTLLLDDSPAHLHPDMDPRHQAWHPPPLPSAAQLAAGALGDTARAVGGLGLRVAAAATQPEQSAATARAALEGVAGALRAGLRASPSAPLGTPAGPHRRVALVPAPLADLRDVEERFGGTLEDVVLTAVAGGLRTWLRARARRVGGVTVLAVVTAAAGAAGPAAPLLVPLPLGAADPIKRLASIAAASARAASSPEMLGAAMLGRLQATGAGSWSNLAGRASTLPVATIDGPEGPLFLLGRRVAVAYPVAPPGGERTLAVALTRYDWVVGIGLVGDPDAVPGFDILADGICEALDDLVARAG